MKSKRSKRERKLWFVLKFFVRFVLLAAPLYFIMESSQSFYVWEKVIADQTILLLSPAVNVNLTEEYGMPVLHLEGFDTPIGIDRSCTGYRSFIAFLALVFAVPNVAWKKRLKPLVPAFFVVYAVNLFRIVTTILVGFYFGVTAFEFAHMLLWRWALTLTILGMWVYWFKKEVKKPGLLTKNS